MVYEKVECPECGEEYGSLGTHWRHNESHRPELTQHQREIITGLMLGDGCLSRQDKNPFLQVKMTTKEYLKELDEIFGCLSTGVNLAMSARENAKENRKTGFSPNANEENYHDMWRWRTRSLPELHEFDWYTGNNSEKVWPDDIELTPTVLTHWYVSDGNWDNRSTHNNIRITTVKEIGNENKIDSYFQSASLPTPSNYSGGKDIQFTVDQSKKLWEYMESPPSGFEYKFPEEYR